MFTQLLLISTCIFVTLNANAINREKLPQPPVNECPEENVENREKRELNANVVIDPVAIVGQINSLVTSADNRSGFVKGVMNSAFYRAQQSYNVMVFNLSQDHEDRFSGVKMFHTVNYHGITYGVWVFEEGTFRNKGDGGWDNWAFKEWFNRDHGYVTFQKP